MIASTLTLPPEADFFQIDVTVEHAEYGTVQYVRGYEAHGAGPLTVSLDIDHGPDRVEWSGAAVADASCPREGAGFPFRATV